MDKDQPDDPRRRDTTAQRQIPMGELVRHLGPDPHDIQFPSRFITPDAARIAGCGEWLRRLGDGPAIGISWRSGRRGEGASKTIGLADWHAVLRARDAKFVNLQYGDTEAEIEQARTATGARVFSHPDIDRFNDLDGLAALIDGLDLVITTSNVTAHLAAALGKPVWLAVKKSPFWYWGTEGAAVPLYPTVRAYRQRDAGDWAPVLGDIATDLEEWIARETNVK